MGLMVPAMGAIDYYDAATVPVLADRMRRLLGQSGLLALPTESFYGLAVAPFDEQALAKLWQVKGRSDGKPILLLIGERSQLEPFVQRVPPAATVLMNAFWPGPLTIVFPAAVGLSDMVTAGTGSVGIRQSAWQPLAELLCRVGPVTGTSANREGLAPCCTAEDVQHNLGDAVDLIVDAGPTPGGRPSTVIDVQGPIRIVREGAITREIIVRQLASHGMYLDGESR
ncbi:MAG: L-threonylcarbamoyladenylate synthase [Nitrospirota bacterium]|jgi:L-threonylcarbamoyladenylate synthase|nr:L-threonylcarbamoyladenylate synthase [Nitrospirota bacterium]